LTGIACGPAALASLLLPQAVVNRTAPAKTRRDALAKVPDIIIVLNVVLNVLNEISRFLDFDKDKNKEVSRSDRFSRRIRSRH